MSELTKKEAQMICEACDLESMLENDEEFSLFEENNPELLAAYEKLLAIAGVVRVK